MADFTINVTMIEELQMTGNTHELDKIFWKARVTVIGGEKILLVRKMANGTMYQFDEISTEDGLEDYKKQVYKYL